MPANERAPRGAPEKVEATFLIDAADFGAPTSFGVQIDVVGKGKTLALPPSSEDPDRFIFTSPGTKVTLTNLESEEEISFNISGSTHREMLPGGGWVDTYVGRNLLGDPEINDGEPGLVVVAGHFTATYNAAGEVVEPLSGTGQIINVIDALM